MSEEQARELIHPFTGDLLMIDRLRKIIIRKSHEHPDFNLSHSLQVIALWHMQWAELRVHCFLCASVKVEPHTDKEP